MKLIGAQIYTRIINYLEVLCSSVWIGCGASFLWEDARYTVFASCSSHVIDERWSLFVPMFVRLDGSRALA